MTWTVKPKRRPIRENSEHALARFAKSLEQDYREAIGTKRQPVIDPTDDDLPPIMFSDGTEEYNDKPWWRWW